MTSREGVAYLDISACALPTLRELILREGEMGVAVEGRDPELDLRLIGNPSLVTLLPVSDPATF